MHRKSCSEDSRKIDPLGKCSPCSSGNAVDLERPPSSEFLTRVHCELETLRKQFDTEREQWLVEKSKVIDYQKRLQLNYAQIARKNCLLQAEVQQLSVELEMQELNEKSPQQSESFC